MLPMNATVRQIAVLACLVAGIVAACWHAEARASGSPHPKATPAHPHEQKKNSANLWDQRAAAAYLDQRASWWMEWPKAARDHETFCISCHTAVPYVLSRPALRNELAEKNPSANERRLLETESKPATHSKEVAPFDSDADPR